MARLRVEVYATSNVKPPSLRSCPPATASVSPFSERGQSTQPVNLFSLFHVLSPCRIKTRVCVVFIKSCDRLVVVDVCCRRDLLPLITECRRGNTVVEVNAPASFIEISNAVRIKRGIIFVFLGLLLGCENLFVLEEGGGGEGRMTTVRLVLYVFGFVLVG